VVDYFSLKREVLIISGETDLTPILIRLAIIEAQLDYLTGSTVVTAVDYTTTGINTVICTAEVTISLDATPLDRAVVEIKQTGFKVFIDGNGKTIEGNSTLTIRKRNTALKTGLVLRYSEAQNEWYAT
jgi:hypothetical protein